MSKIKCPICKDKFFRHLYLYIRHIREQRKIEKKLSLEKKIKDEPHTRLNDKILSKCSKRIRLFK